MKTFICVFKPIICENTVGSTRPTLDKFDETFAIENEFDGKKWVPVQYESFNKINVVNPLKQRTQVPE